MFMQTESNCILKRKPMKIIYCLWLFIPSTLFAQVRKVQGETTVQSVTIFSSGAQVSRTSSVAIQPGRTEISFSGLSNQLEQQSVQLKADANLTLLSVQTIKDYLGQRKIETEEKSFIEKRTELQDKINSENRLLQVYKKEEEMLTKNQSIGGQSGVKADELRQVLDLQRQRLTENYLKQMEIEKRIQQEQQELNRISAQLVQFSKKKDSVSYTVLALIDSKITQNVNFKLLYTIKDAGWYPTYDLRVTDVTKPINLLMNANVFQRSGETWKDVSLVLSTGNPSDNATPSELQPWMLGFYDPSASWARAHALLPGTISGRVVDENSSPLAGATIIIRGTNTATMTDANGFFKIQNIPVNGSVMISAAGYASNVIPAKTGYYNITLKQISNELNEVVVIGYGASRRSDIVGAVSPLSKSKEEIQTVSVTTDYQPTTMVYKIDEKYNLETDGKTTTIAIKKIEIPTSFEYFSIPKVDPSAFLTAKIINWQDYDLQPGETNLYFEGTFLGKTYLDVSAANDTLSVAIGKDNNIHVTRKLIKEYSSHKFIGSNRTDSRTYEITVLNTRKVPVNIDVQDQVPVSTTKEISIDDINAPGADLDKQTGIANWKLTLAAGQEKKLQLSYNVKYPKDRKVVLE
jgi:hypothetical protein